MKKNTLFHHKKFLRNGPHHPKEQSESKELFLQNPENYAKFSLLQISQEAPKSSSKTFLSFQRQHSRSYSTQFFNNKQISIDKNFESPQGKELHHLRKIFKEDKLQSVAMKSTFSNEMRRTYHPSSNYSLNELQLSKEKDETKKIGSRNDSIKKLRKLNYLPMTQEQQREIENIEEIFKTAPSKQILAILNRTKIGRQIRQNDKNSKEKFDEQITPRKKSIFNIRHLMLKQKVEEEQNGRRKQSNPKRAESPNHLQPKQLHSTNRNVIKMRLKNRYNKSSNSKRG